MQLEEMKNLILTCKKDYSKIINWNNGTIPKAEYDMLCEIGAITNRGVACDRPYLKIVSNGEINHKDFDGDIGRIQAKADEINSSTVKARAYVSYLPYLYPLYRKAQKEICKKFYKEKIAIEINTPPELVNI